jgi:hypothetical protein
LIAEEGIKRKDRKGAQRKVEKRNKEIGRLVPHGYYEDGCDGDFHPFNFA